MTLRAILLACLAVLLWGAEARPAQPPLPPDAAGIDFALAAPVLEIGGSLVPIGGGRFTLAVKNSGSAPSARILMAADAPDAALVFVPPDGHARLIAAETGQPAVRIERAIPFGADAYRVTIAGSQAASLTLRIGAVSRRPVLLAWNENALTNSERNTAILLGAIVALFAASFAFALGAAVLSGTALARAVALFLAALLAVQLPVSGLLDASAIAWSGPFAWVGLGLAAVMATGLYLIDEIAPLRFLLPTFADYRHYAAAAILLPGVLAYFNVPPMGFVVRVLALLAGLSVPAYLAHRGRGDTAAARRLSPAATVFALVAAASAGHALGFFGANPVAPIAIAGFSAAGALLLAVAAAVPMEPARKNAGDDSDTPDTTDALTGLGTLASLIAALEALRDRSKSAALAVFDIDRFKSINTSLGREGGDAALIAFARRFSGAMPGGGSVFRVGGDTFAALAPDVSDLEGFGERLLQLASAPFRIGSRDIYLPCSAGVAGGPTPQGLGERFVQAERAMVEAKREGGGRAIVYSSGLDKVGTHDAVSIDSGLRRALERGEIEIHYQPLVRLKDRAVAGFEALMRWRHPEHGLIGPADFVPLAERSGLIVPLGRFALSQAAADLARWQRAFPGEPPLFVSVNAAWPQIKDKAFADDLKALLAASGLQPGSLKLELTEGQLIATGQAETALKRLKALGLGLAIDDFGTGHSSLGRLASLPFDTLKLDRSFIAGSAVESGAKILRSMIGLARDLEMTVICEGVETETEAELLLRLGCDCGQGYLFGVPKPAAEIFERR